MIFPPRSDLAPDSRVTSPAKATKFSIFSMETPRFLTDLLASVGDFHLLGSFGGITVCNGGQFRRKPAARSRHHATGF